MIEKSLICYDFLLWNSFIISVLIGVGVGFVFGFGLRVVELLSDVLIWIGKLLLLLLILFLLLLL